MSNNELDLVILKHIISNKKRALEFVNECDTKIFSPEVWNFANILTSYIRVIKELPTLRVLEERYSKDKNVKIVENIKKIWDLLDKVVVDDREYRHDLDKIKKRFAEKQILSFQELLSKNEPGSVDVTKTLADMQKTIQSIRSVDESKNHERKTLRAAIPAFQEKFNAKRTNPNLDVGIRTGYSFFDFATNGVKPADFILIAGESGFGKSLLLMNFAVQIWMQKNTIDNLLSFEGGKNVVFFSLEMPYEDCFGRLLSRLSGVPSRKIDNPYLYPLEPDEFKKMKAALKFIKEYPYEFEIVDIADATANDLDLILNDITYIIDAVFVDYLGIMKPNEKSDEADWLKQGVVAYETRAIARKRSLPIFSAVQLNRKSQAKDSSESIGLNRLARSATIATHATQVLQIESRSGEEKFPDMMVHLIKNRKGPKNKGRLIKNLSCATLIDDKPEENESKEKFVDYESSDIDDISSKIELLEI